MSNTVKAMLQYSAFPVRNDLGIEYDPLREGAGALNGARAVDLDRRRDHVAVAGGHLGQHGGMTAQSTAWKDIEPTSTGAQ